MSASRDRLREDLPPRLRSVERPVQRGTFAYGALGVAALVAGLVGAGSTLVIFGAATLVFFVVLVAWELRGHRQELGVDVGLLPVVQPTDDQTDGRIRTLDRAAVVVVDRTPGWLVLEDQTGAPYLLARPGRRAEAWRRENAAPTATELGFPDDQRPAAPTLRLED